MSCPICGKIVTHTLNPCGHCLCINCIRQISDCPICRSRFTSTIKIYLEPYSLDLIQHNFVNLSHSQLDFLYENRPAEIANPSSLGIVLSPLLKLKSLAEGHDLYRELFNCVLKFAVPTMQPNKDSRNLLLGLFPIRFVNDFTRHMSSRLEMIKSYGTASIILLKEELNDMNNILDNNQDQLIKLWLNTIKEPFIGNGFFNSNKKKIKYNFEEQRKEFLKNQLLILETINEPSNIELALKNLSKCYSNVFDDTNCFENSSFSSVSDDEFSFDNINMP